MTEPSKPRKYRYSLRFLMFFVLVAAVWLGWRVERARTQKEAIEAVKEHGGWVHFDYEFSYGKLVAGGKPRWPDWLVNAIGEEYFREIRQVSLVYDGTGGNRLDNPNVQPCEDVLAILARLPGLRKLLLKETQATDDGLRHIGRMTDMEELYMWDAADVTDAGIAHLNRLDRLKTIHVSDSKLTDESLVLLSQMPAIRDLSLQSNHFTDSGLARMSGQNRIERLFVGMGKSRFTDTGIVHLAEFGQLKALDLQGSTVSMETLHQLARMPKLKRIFLGVSLPKPDLEELKKIRPDLKIQ